MHHRQGVYGLPLRRRLALATVVACDVGVLRLFELIEYPLYISLSASIAPFMDVGSESIRITPQVNRLSHFPFLSSLSDRD